MGWKSALNLLVEITEDPSYKEIEKELRKKIEKELDKADKKMDSFGNY